MSGVRHCTRCGRPGANWARGLGSGLNRTVLLCADDQKELNALLERHASELKTMTTRNYGQEIHS